ncbi:MAG: lipopolysaccharide biosynthesis protein [Bacteroidaceae bacterium]|nr:lipopolysaccharide biosynthesis protein [Bacteroidaceae bacterium]
MEQESVTQKTARTTFWSSIEKFSTMGIQFVVTILLARLLLPSDYGVIAMLTIFIGIATNIVECGFANALIRKCDCTQKDYSTAFYFNVIASSVIYLILFFSAPWIASFYEMDILSPVLRVFSITIIINSFNIVQNAMLIKDLHFKRLAKISTIACLLSGIISIGAAYVGFGVWALVLQSISTSFITVLLMFFYNRWMPSILFSRESFSYLWNFGSKMLYTGILSAIYNNIYSLIIGKVYNSELLGLYNRSNHTAQLVPNIVDGIFKRNSLAIMSQVQDNQNRLVDVYRKFVILVTFISFPCSLLLVSLAKPFTLFLLTDKWAESIIYLQIFSIGMLSLTANTINHSIFQVTGRTDITLKAELIKKFIGVALVLSLIPFGTLILAVGASAFNFFCYAINLYYAKKLLGMSFSVQIKDMLPCFIAACISAFVAYIPVYFISYSAIALICGCVIGVSTYVFITKYVIHVGVYDYINLLCKKHKS